LRGYLFGDKKYAGEVFFSNSGETYNSNFHALKDEDIDKELLETIVKNILRKASFEKKYCIFYGQLCEDMIKLETILRGLEPKIRNTCKSIFRAKLLEVCK